MKKKTKKPVKKKAAKKKTAKKASPSLASQGAALTKALKKASTPPLFIAMGSDSFIFYSDLVRKVELDIHCEFVTQSNLTSVGTLDVKNKNTVLVFAKKPAAAAQTSLKKLFMSAGASNVLVVSK